MARSTECYPIKYKTASKKVQASQIDNIMFNIDSVSGQQDGKDKITRIIFNQFNRFRGLTKQILH